MEGCWVLLLRTLRSFAVAPAIARRRAQALWSSLAWPADNSIKSFHTLLRRALVAMERNNIAPTADMAMVKYRDLVPEQLAIHLEDSLRTPYPHGWTLDAMMKEADQYCEIRAIYAKTGDGGMPRARNRATWANDQRMMKTPLGLRAPPQAGGSHQNPNGCPTGGGTGHQDAQCPNHTARTDTNFQGKSVKARRKGCLSCGGVGH